MSLSKHVPITTSQNIIYDDFHTNGCIPEQNILMTHNELIQLLTLTLEPLRKCRAPECVISSIKGYTNQKCRLPNFKMYEHCLLCHLFLKKPVHLTTDAATNLSICIEGEYGENKLKGDVLSFAYLYENIFIVNDILYYYRILRHNFRSIYDIKEIVQATFPGTEDCIETMYNFTHKNKTIYDTTCRRYVLACFCTVNTLLQQEAQQPINIIDHKEIMLEKETCDFYIRYLYDFIQLSSYSKKIKAIAGVASLENIRTIRLQILYIVDLLILYRVYLTTHNTNPVLNIFSVHIPNAVYNEAYLTGNSANHLLQKLHAFIQKYRKTINIIPSFAQFRGDLQDIVKDDIVDLYFIINLYKTIFLRSMTIFVEDATELVTIDQRLFLLTFSPLLFLYVLSFGYIQNQAKTQCPFIYAPSCFLTRWIKYAHLTVNVINYMATPKEDVLEADDLQYCAIIHSIRTDLLVRFQTKSADTIIHSIKQGYCLEGVYIHTQQNRSNEDDVLLIYDQAYKLKQPSCTHIIDVRDYALQSYISERFELTAELTTRDPSNTNQFLRLALWFRYIYQYTAQVGIPLSLYLLFIKPPHNANTYATYIRHLKTLLTKPLSFKAFDEIRKSIDTKNRPSRAKTVNTIVLNTTSIAISNDTNQYSVPENNTAVVSTQTICKTSTTHCKSDNIIHRECRVSAINVVQDRQHILPANKRCKDGSTKHTSDSHCETMTDASVSDDTIQLSNPNSLKHTKEKKFNPESINKKFDMNERLLYDIYPSVTNKLNELIDNLTNLPPNATSETMIQLCIAKLTKYIPALLMYNKGYISQLIKFYESVKDYTTLNNTDTISTKKLQRMLLCNLTRYRNGIIQHSLELQFQICCALDKDHIWNEIVNTFSQIKPIEVVALSYEDINVYTTFYYCNICKYTTLQTDKQGKIIQHIPNGINSSKLICKICLSSLSECMLCLGQVATIYYKNIKSKNKSGATKKNVHVSLNNITERQSIVPPSILMVTLCFYCHALTLVNETYNHCHRYYCKSCFNIFTDQNAGIICIKSDINSNCTKDFIAVPVLEGNIQKWAYICTHCFVPVDFLTPLKSSIDLLQQMQDAKLKCR